MKRILLSAALFAIFNVQSSTTPTKTSGNFVLSSIDAAQGEWDPDFDGDVTPSLAISNVIFGQGQGSLKTDTARKIVPWQFGHNFMAAHYATPHDTLRFPKPGSAGSTSITIASTDLPTNAQGVAHVPVILIKVTTQAQFMVPGGGYQVTVSGKTPFARTFSSGPYDVVRGTNITSFAIIPVDVLEAGKYALPVSALIDATNNLSITIDGTTINDNIEVLIPGPGAVEMIAILGAAGLNGLAIKPGA